MSESKTPIEDALRPLRYAWWKINLDPGGWADIDIYFECNTPGCERNPGGKRHCGCILTESTQSGVWGIDDMIARAVKRYLADPRSEDDRKNFTGEG